MMNGTTWVYVNFFADVPRVEDIPVMISDTYLGEEYHGFKNTGAFLEKPDKEEIAIHIKEYFRHLISK